MSFPKSVSIVIAFRDWGFERLSLCLRSVRESLKDIDFEIIVSDYGSAEWRRTEEICNEHGAMHLYTDAKTWSKPKALNVGFSTANGEIVISLDADMIVSPTTLPIVVQTVASTYPSTAVVTSRDLPPHLDHEGVEEIYGDWNEIERNSRRRARWGVGGCFAFHKKMLHVLGGIDERMTRYGAEDLDFTDRCRRMGARVAWLDQREVRMYHMWHPSTADQEESNPEVKQAFDANRKIYYNDKTITRNEQKRQPKPYRAPLISVILSTFNRAGFLAESVNSVLAQSIGDFELVIVDDGSTDHTEDVVKRFEDDRIRYYKIDNSGIAAARNFGLTQAKGAYIAVHDDDDLMFPDRLENSLKAMVAGVGATYGAVLNFEDSTGELHPYVTKMEYGKDFAQASTASPGHATWLVRRELMESTPYDENLSAGVDHNVAVRSVALGWKWAHTQKFMYARRRHKGQITDSTGIYQAKAAKRTSMWARSLVPKEERSKAVEKFKKLPYPRVKEYSDLEGTVLAWLPDHLVERDVLFHVEDPREVDSSIFEGSLVGIAVKPLGSGLDPSLAFVEGATWADLATIRSKFGHFQLLRHRRRSSSSGESRRDEIGALVLKHLMEASDAEVALVTSDGLEAVNDPADFTLAGFGSSRMKLWTFNSSEELDGWIDRQGSALERYTVFDAREKNEV